MCVWLFTIFSVLVNLQNRNFFSHIIQSFWIKIKECTESVFTCLVSISFKLDLFPRITLWLEILILSNSTKRNWAAKRKVINPSNSMKLLYYDSGNSIGGKFPINIGHFLSSKIQKTKHSSKKSANSKNEIISDCGSPGTAGFSARQSSVEPNLARRLRPGKIWNSRRYDSSKGITRSKKTYAL